MQPLPRTSTLPAQAKPMVCFVGSYASSWTSTLEVNTIVTPRLLEQRFNLLLELLQGRESSVLKADPSVAGDYECRRIAGHWCEGLLKVIAIVTDKHRIVHLVLFNELPHVRCRIIH